MPDVFLPLEFKLIDEGGCLADTEKNLADLQEALISHCKEYGDKSEGAKAEMAMKIILTHEGKGLFSIKHSHKTTLPAKPAVISLAMADEDQTGQKRFMVRQKGSTFADPHQGTLALESTAEAEIPEG